MNNRLKNKRLFFMLIIFSTVGCQNTPINDDGSPTPTFLTNTTVEKPQPSDSQSLKKGPFGNAKTVTSKRPTQRTCWDTSGEGRVFILAVGSNMNGLTETNRDAKRFAKTMRELFHVRHNRVCVLANAYKEEFVQALERLGDSRRVGADDLVIIFYSGHGAQSNDDNDDEKLDRLDEFFGTIAPKPRTRYLLRDDDFSALIQNIPTPNILTFIDACFSAGLTKGDNSKKPIKNERIKYFDATTFDDATIPNSGRTHVGTTLDPVKGVLLSASMENQPAVELARRGGRFTLFFLEALKQARQKRQLVDLLTVFEKTRHNVYQHSQQHSDKVQIPVKKGPDEIFRRINGYIP